MTDVMKSPEKPDTKAGTDLLWFSRLLILFLCVVQLFTLRSILLPPVYDHAAISMEWGKSKSTGISQPLPVPDARWSGYTDSDLRFMWNGWGEQGVRWYVVSQFILDFVFPLLYGAVLFFLARLTVRKQLADIFTFIIGIGILFDFAENIFLISMASNFLPTDESMTWYSSICTTAKFGTLALVLSFCILCALILLLRSFFSTKGRQNWVRILSETIRCRFPLAFGGILLFWGVLSVSTSELKPLAANVLLIDGPSQLLGLACVNGLAVVFSVAMLRAILHQCRFERDAQIRTEAWTWPVYLQTVAIAFITPAAAFIYSLHESTTDAGLAIEFGKQWPVLSGLSFSPIALTVIAALIVLLGVALSFLIIMLLGFVIGSLFGHEKGNGNFFPFEDRRQKGLLSLESHIRRHFDAEMTVYLVLVLLLYVTVLPYMNNSVSGLWSVPAYVVIVLWIASIIFSGLSAKLDSTRVPITALLILLVVFSRALSHRTGHLPTQIRTVASSTTDTPSSQPRRSGSAGASVVPMDPKEDPADDQHWNAVLKRMNRTSVQPTEAEHGRTLVVVTCPGGGIHAAVWSSLVMQQLHTRYARFADSVCLISGVSGGSVGSIFYVNETYPLTTNGAKSNPYASTPSMPAKSSAASALESIGNGVAFHDLPSALYPFYIPGKDRGERLEEFWSKKLISGSSRSTVPTLAEWGKEALEGDRPIVILNATDAVSGRRVLFSSLPVPDRPSMQGRLGRPYDYRELIDARAYDFSVATAARASATFPYVSPFTSPDRPTTSGLIGDTAIGDGGYADNEGIVSAVEWIDLIAHRASDELEKQPAGEREKHLSQLPFRRIVLLRIQPSPDFETKEAEQTKAGSLAQGDRLRWLAGPVEALASMRSASPGRTRTVGGRHDHIADAP
ncbi:MAG: patatin-like phospholipase family protein [Pirellulales bacterium]